MLSPLDSPSTIEELQSRVGQLERAIKVAEARAAKLNKRLSAHESMLAKSRSDARRELKAAEGRIMKLEDDLAFYEARELTESHDFNQEK